MVDPSKIKQYAGLFGKGLLRESAPGVVAGIINELFHEWNVDIAKVTDHVQYRRSLWDELDPKYQQALKQAAKLSDLNFLTPSFVIHAISKEFPAVASLFLNWTAAGEWLAHQINDLKKQITSQTTD